MNTFPSPATLVEVERGELDKLQLGLKRGGRLYEVTRAAVSGELNLDSLHTLPYLEARSRLMSHRGIGQEIADCVCLFSLDKAEALPVDRHIGAALLESYGMKYTLGAKNFRLLEWARSQFGDHAGCAGQLLLFDHLSQDRQAPL